jgi:hypothetical protein
MLFTAEFALEVEAATAEDAAAEVCLIDVYSDAQNRPAARQPITRQSCRFYVFTGFPSKTGCGSPACGSRIFDNSEAPKTARGFRAGSRNLWVEGGSLGHSPSYVGEATLRPGFDPSDST